MSKPQRIQRRRAKGFKLPDNTVCVDRTTPWGNPFVVGQHGTRDECVELYKMSILGYTVVSKGPAAADAAIKLRKYVCENIETLRGKNLACFCRLDQRCHATFLLLAANPTLQEKDC